MKKTKKVRVIFRRFIRLPWYCFATTGSAMGLATGSALLAYWIFGLIFLPLMWLRNDPILSVSEWFDGALHLLIYGFLPFFVIGLAASLTILAIQITWDLLIKLKNGFKHLQKKRMLYA